MELLIIVALLCLAAAVQPLASQRLPAFVHGTLGSLCVAVSLALTALFAGGFITSTPVRAALPDVDRPAPEKPASASPSEAVPNDEGRFFAPANDPAKNAADKNGSPDIEINTPPEGVIIPHGRPAWVEAPPVREGAIHTMVLCSDPYARQDQAMHALDEKIKAAAAEYIGEYLQSELAPQLIRFSLGDLKAKLLRPENVYQEKIVVSIGPMHQVHAQLEFNEEFRALLARRWGEMRATYRLAETGLVSGGVLLLLATIFGYFRLDNATRGYYTGRLQFMAAAAILTIVASGTMFARWIHWL